MSGAWAVPGYRHVRPLGTGAAGSVFLGVHRPTEIPVAIKVLAPELLRDAAFLDRLRRDAQQLSELEDPGMVRLYEMYESADEPMGPPRRAAVVTELVDGVSMAQLLNSDGPVEPEAALVVLSRMLTALETAHRAGVLHRDVKPANVLVGGDGHPRLSDFGLAVHESEHAPAPGTPAYFAPELWDGGAATPRTDLYAATAVFYECLSGESPYPSLNLLQLATAHRSAQIPMHGIPEPLRPIVLQGLAKGAGERAESAAALLDLVQAVAVATYGFGWEENGRAELESRAAVLRLLFPLSRPIEPDTGDRARTLLGAPPPDPARHSEQAASSEPGDRAGRQQRTRRAQDPQDLPALTDLDPSPQRADEYATYSEYAGYADHIEHHEEHEGQGALAGHDGHPGHDGHDGQPDHHGHRDPGDGGDRGRPVPGGHGAEPKREAPAKGRSGGRRRLSGGVLLAGLATVAVMLGGTGAAVYATHAGGSSPDKATVTPEQSDDEAAGGPSPEPETGDYTSGPVAKDGVTPSGSPTASPKPPRRKPTPPGTPSGSPPGSPPSGVTPSPGGGDTPPPTAATGVSELTVTWNRSGTSGTGTGTVTVTTTGTGTVNLLISYFEDGEAAGTETVRLSGSRSYTRRISHTAEDRCAPQSVRVSSDPAPPGGSERGTFARNSECWWLP